MGSDAAVDNCDIPYEALAEKVFELPEIILQLLSSWLSYDFNYCVARNFTV